MKYSKSFKSQNWIINIYSDRYYFFLSPISFLSLIFYNMFWLIYSKSKCYCFLITQLRKMHEYLLIFFLTKKWEYSICCFIMCYFCLTINIGNYSLVHRKLFSLYFETQRFHVQLELFLTMCESAYFITASSTEVGIILYFSNFATLISENLYLSVILLIFA